jgi:hypothetical protein
VLHNIVTGMKVPAPKGRKRIAPGVSPGTDAREEGALKDILPCSHVTIKCDPQ